MEVDAATVVPPILGALTGGLTGAIAGGIVGWWAAPTRAEREERGKKRIDARRTVAIAIRQYDAAIRRHRQLRYQGQTANSNDLETAAVSFSGDIRHVASVLPMFERRRLLRSAQSVAGPSYWREAELRPFGQYSRSAVDAIALAATKGVRPSLAKKGLTPALVGAHPPDARWDKLLADLAKLRKHYS